MPSASVQAMSRSTAPGSATRPPVIHSRTSLSSRDQTHDIDDATLNVILQSSADRKAFIRAQQDALDAINDAALARAIEASKETAALEVMRRREHSDASQSLPVASTSRAAQEQIPQQEKKEQKQKSTSSSSSTSSNPAPVPSTSQQAADDEAAARELARSWRVDHLQPVLLNNPSVAVSSASVSASAAAGKVTDAQSKSVRRSPSAAPVSSSSSKASVTPISTAPAASGSASTAVSGSSRSATPPVPGKPIPSSSSRPPLYSTASVAALSSSPPKASARPPLRSAATDMPVMTRSYSVAPTARPSVPRSNLPTVSASAAASAHASRQLSRGTSTSSTSSTSTSASSSSKRSDTSLSRNDMPSPMKLPTLSNRDLITGTLKNPGKEKLPAHPEQVAPRGCSPEQEYPELLELFKASRSCAHCGAMISSPRPLLLPSEAHPNHLTNFLHVRCSSCAANHCRGCFSLITCPRNCSGGEACSLKTCCSQVRAIAIFEALSSFDYEYATEANLVGRNTKADRQNYLTHVLENKDKRATQRFEKALIPTLRTICSWLQPSDVVDGKFHPSVERLFALSYLPEVIHTFLNHKRMVDWVSLSESYVQILEVLGTIGNCGLSQLLTEPLPNIEHSCGLQCRVWDGGVITWESNAKNEFVYSPPLSLLVKGLEAHRRPLMELADKARFQPTMDKTHALCEGIAYLSFQQMTS